MRMLDANSLMHGKVLVRVPNWLGDAVMCLPAVRGLRAALPDAELTLLARPWVRDVFPVQELRCQVLDYDSGSANRGWSGRKHIAAQLQARSFDAAILFQNALDAALLAWLAQIPMRAGYARQWRSALLTHPVRAPRRGEIPQHETHYYLELLRRLNLIGGYAAVQEILLDAQESRRRAAQHKLRTLLGQSAATDRPIIGISPGASFGTAKRWPADRFAELARRLASETGACVFFGSAEEALLAEEVAAAAGGISLAGKTSLAEFMQTVQGCDLFIANDTGTTHVAAGLGVPTLVLFGPTNERETAPLGPRVKLLTGEAFCRPCKLRHCPLDHRCMKTVPVEQVLHTARGLLGDSQRPSREPAIGAAQK